MTLSERRQRQIDGLLDQAEEAIARGDWDTVWDRSAAVLRVDPETADAQGYLTLAGAITPIDSCSQDG